jgi:hypothetical protein
MRRKIIIIAGLICAFVLVAAVLLPALQVAKWVGHTDVDIQFRVIDSETHAPIAAATIYIAPQEGLPFDEQTREAFSIVTDDNGLAARMATGCMCAGSKGMFEDTFFPSLPPWTYQVKAEGYEDSAKLQLVTRENANNAKRGPPHATVVIPVSLHKQP